jgi:cysteine-rich repeat protein
VTACGNRITTAGEECDDGDAVDGDGCDSNCTVTACGNGIVTGQEACDDGNTVSGDGCEADCTVPSACSPGRVRNGLVRVHGVDGDAGDELVVFKGRIDRPGDASRLVERHVHAWVEDVATGQLVWDLTHAPNAMRHEKQDRRCKKAGWWLRSAGRKDTYRRCGEGVVLVRLVERPDLNAVDFVVVAHTSMSDTLVGPLTAGIALTEPGDTADACGSLFTPTRCHFDRHGRTISCR